MRENFVPVACEAPFYQSILLDKILTERGAERTCVSIHFKYRADQQSSAEVAHSFNPVRIFQDQAYAAIAEFADKNFLLVSRNSRNRNGFWDMTATGDYDWAVAFRDRYQNVPERKGRIKWHYSRKGDVESKSFDLEKPLPIHDEFYPFIPGGIDAYFDAYMASRAAILVMIGPPGTGKTSALRHFLYSRGLTASVTFDELVLADEEYFIDFASGDDHGDAEADVMIVEDADLLLTARESEQNKIMAKLLNISEGLIPLDRKKMIFTTNLPNVNRIDPALIRSGRCFDVAHFRPLTVAEAVAAAGVVGIPFKPDKKEITLADLFGGERQKEEIERFKLLKTA